MADTTIDLLKNSSYVGKMDELIAAVKSGGGTASDVEWDNVKNKPTTIGGYGIIDAKIDNGTITLGNQTITPLTSAPVTSVNNKTGVVTLSAADVSAIPSTLTGTAGQVLTKTADGQEWKDVQIPSGTNDHSKLSNRDAADQHPIGAITGLEAALANIPPTDAFIVTLTQDEAGTYSVDKTFAEIQTEIQSNRTVYLYFQEGSRFLSLVAHFPDVSVVFGFVSVASSAVHSLFFVVFNDDHVELQQKTLSKLPNPNALTFTGAVTGSYDGSAPLSVEIPGGGSGNNDWELLADVTLTEDVATIAITQTPSGEAFSVRELVIIGTPISDGTNKTVQFAPYATEIKYGVSLVSMGEVLSSTDGGKSYLSALIQVLPEVVYARTQYTQYDNSNVGYANKLNASHLRNEAMAGYEKNGDPITKFAIGVWSGGTAGVFRAGTKMRVYGR